MAMEFVVPDFVLDNAPEDIQERMMNNLPPDIDDMPGGFPYDFTMPTAIEKSELIQFHMVRTLMLMFPQYAWGEWLDLHGKAAGVPRKAGGYASGKVSFEGLEGTVIRKGFVVCTPATDISPSTEYATDEETVIDESGYAVVSVTAVQSGESSNVGPDTIVLMSKPLNGITQIKNEDKITGGTDEEDDESYCERIQETNEAKGTSNIGNDSDYIRWAKEVVGVGSVIVIPECDGPGTVGLVIMDSNGMAANEKILKAVYDYIMSPEDRLKRKAPIGVTLTVDAPAEKMFSYSCKIILAEEGDLSYITDTFKKEVLKYYETAKREGILRYTKVCAILSSISGLADYSDLLINDEEQKNWNLHETEYPTTGTVLFEVGDDL